MALDIHHTRHIFPYISFFFIYCTKLLSTIIEIERKLVNFPAISSGEIQELIPLDFIRGTSIFSVRAEYPIHVGVESQLVNTETSLQINNKVSDINL